jgi:colanic acid biosynthesis glycosyl transferase WcaI
MSHILFVSYFFTPDSLSTAVLMAELAQELQALGHRVTVITTTPHYNLEDEALAKQPLRRRWGRWLQESDLDGIRVLHVQVAPKGSRLWLRALDYLRYHLIGLLAGILLVHSADVVFAPSPPLTIGVHAWLLALWQRAPFVYNVQEIYPDIAVKLGVLRNPPLIRALELLERFVYARAARVAVISEWFRRTLRAKGVPDDKLAVVPNFVDTEFVCPRPRRNAFSAAHGLDGKFVALYAGNVGLTQGFDTVIEAARRAQAMPALHFLIVGGGAQFAWLEEQIARHRLDNVTLLPHQPRSAVPDLYATANLCLVPMKRATTQDTFPSKIYTIMAAGRPALVAAEPDTELAWVVESSGCGWVVPPGDAHALSAALLHAFLHPAEAQERGRRGRAYVEAHHARRAVARRYSDLFAALAGR